MKEMPAQTCMSSHVHPSGDETSVAQLWCTVAGIQASRPTVCTRVEKWMENTFPLVNLGASHIYCKAKGHFLSLLVHRNSSLHHLYISARDSDSTRLIQSCFCWRQRHILLFNIAAQWWVISFAKVFSWMFTKVYLASKYPKSKCIREFNSLC